MIHPLHLPRFEPSSNCFKSGFTNLWESLVLVRVFFPCFVSLTASFLVSAVGLNGSSPGSSSASNQIANLLLVDILYSSFILTQDASTGNSMQNAFLQQFSATSTKMLRRLPISGASSPEAITVQLAKGYHSAAPNLCRGQVMKSIHLCTCVCICSIWCEMILLSILTLL